MVKFVSRHLDLIRLLFRIDNELEIIGVTGV